MNILLELVSKINAIDRYNLQRVWMLNNESIRKYINIENIEGYWIFY